MATHSSNLALRIPWTEEPSRLQSMGLQRVRHDWATITYRSVKEDSEGKTPTYRVDLFFKKCQVSLVKKR